MESKSSVAFEIRLEEYKSLRDEIQNQIQAVHRLEAQVVIFAGAVYSFGLFGISPDHLSGVLFLIYWVPLVVFFTNLFRAKECKNAIDNIATYLRSVENKYGELFQQDYQSHKFETRGWENFQLSRKVVAGEASTCWLFRTRPWRELSIHEDPDGYIDRVWPLVGILIACLAVVLTAVHFWASPLSSGAVNDARFHSIQIQDH